MSGLTVARKAEDLGWESTLFEKARGPGGRMSTRRRDGGQFDHGAQYFTAQSPEFSNAVRGWAKAGAVAEWNGNLCHWADGRLSESDETAQRWVGFPRMSALTRHLSGGLSLCAGTRVEAMTRSEGVWRLRSTGGDSHGPFEAVVLTCPGPQAAALAPVGSEIHTRAKSLDYSPCWAGLLDGCDSAAVAADGVRFDHPVIAWAARDSSKPGRPPGDRWVVHAQPEWTRSHVEDSPDSVASALAGAVRETLGFAPSSIGVHRWLYSLALAQGGASAVFEPSLGLGLCGDGLVGGRIEDAWTSASEMVRLLATGRSL